MKNNKNISIFPHRTPSEDLGYSAHVFVGCSDPHSELYIMLLKNSLSDVSHFSNLCQTLGTELDLPSFLQPHSLSPKPDLQRNKNVSKPE